MWHVYLLSCSDGTLYCGMSNNLQKKLSTHNSGKGARYTRARLPVFLVYSEEVGSLSEAMIREHAIKKLTRMQKFALINS